jgi:hypothetical protein
MSGCSAGGEMVSAIYPGWECIGCLKEPALAGITEKVKSGCHGLHENL